MIECAEEHLGRERAGRYLRKFYPWYADTLGLTKRSASRSSPRPARAHARVELRARGLRGAAELGGLTVAADEWRR